MITRIWYKLIRMLFDSYEERLVKNIPQDTVELFTRYQIDLYEVRFTRSLLSVHQVEMVLDDNKDKFDTLQRVVMKNILYQLKLMDEGYVYREEDKEFTGVSRHSDKMKPKLWKQDPIIPYKESGFGIGGYGGKYTADEFKTVEKNFTAENYDEAMETLRQEFKDNEAVN